MKTITIKLYQYDDLAPNAQKKAREWAASLSDLFAWGDEWMASLNTFCAHFGVKAKDWSVGSCHGWATTDADNSHFRGVKLRNFDRDYCPMGFCGDGDFWITFYDVFKATGDAKHAFNHAIDTGMTAWSADIAYYYSEEVLADFLRNNGYVFTEDGKPWLM